MNPYEYNVSFVKKPSEEQMILPDSSGQWTATFRVSSDIKVIIWKNTQTLWKVKVFAWKPMTFCHEEFDEVAKWALKCIKDTYGV